MNPQNAALSSAVSSSRAPLKAQLAYWVPTGLLALLMAFSGFGNATLNAQSLELMHHLGYPDYFTCLLGVAKLLGAAALVLPVPRVLREWAYAGFAFDVIGATVSLFASGEGFPGAAFPLLVLGLVLLSRHGWLKRERAET